VRYPNRTNNFFIKTVLTLEHNVNLLRILGLLKNIVGKFWEICDEILAKIIHHDQELSLLEFFMYPAR